MELEPRMTTRSVATLAPVLAPVLAAVLAAGIAWGSAAIAEDAAEAPAHFTEDYLADPASIEVGKAIWEEQCRHCHGKSSYPGKAPKLKPKRYKPDFVFNRVTNGFRKMPPWKDVYSREERMSVVAYVLSKGFSP